tara:strand:+ start:6484 stop:6903 length:420 start_codon:yes stop_codon:yes gene_type:complete
MKTTRKNEARLIELMMAKQQGAKFTVSELQEYNSLLNGEKTSTNANLKATKDKAKKAFELAEKQAKNVIRLAAAQALQILEDAQIPTDKKTINISYKAKATSKASSKYVSISLSSPRKLKAIKDKKSVVVKGDRIGVAI